jgi:uncharacterized protein (TIGR00369 family)
MAPRSELLRAFLPTSPLVGHLGIALEELGTDRAVLVMPFRPELVTIGDTIHGGAIAALADTAAMAAAWASEEEAPDARGSTASLTVAYAAAARGEDLRAEARVVRRGRRLCVCEVSVTAPGDRVVASALATYAFG